MVRSWPWKVPVSRALTAGSQMTCRGLMALLLATYRVRHGAIGEEGVHPLAQPGVEDPHHQPQLRVELLRSQRGMEVAQVVLAEQRERLGGPGPGRGERIAVQLRPLDYPHPGEARDPRSQALVLGPEQDGDELTGRHHHSGGAPVTPQ
jgi:hypothetical protein